MTQVILKFSHSRMGKYYSESSPKASTMIKKEYNFPENKYFIRRKFLGKFFLRMKYLFSERLYSFIKYPLLKFVLGESFIFPASTYLLRKISSKSFYYYARSLLKYTDFFKNLCYLYDGAPVNNFCLCKQKYHPRILII